MRTIICLMLMLILSPISRANNTPKQTVSKIIKLAEKNICNPSLLESKEWKDFVKKIQSESFLNLNDSSFVKAFNKEARKLNFSHFYLKSNKYRKNASKKKLPFELEEINPSTAHLHIRQFSSNAAGMYKIVQEIAQNGYKNLIVDLRNNSGGTLDAAVVLGQFLTNEPIDAGTYVTRSWFEQKKRYPTKAEIEKFPYLKDMSYKGFRKISKELAFRMVLPPHNNPTYQGNVYVLINSRTASACEPLVYVFKRKKIGQIIGERTAGQMLSAQWFQVNKDLSVFIPTVDYLTEEATRIDMVGVSPDIEVSSENALKEALKQVK